MTKQDDEGRLPGWLKIAIIIFAIFGFYTFMQRVSPCDAAHNCTYTNEYDPADQQW